MKRTIVTLMVPLMVLLSACSHMPQQLSSGQIEAAMETMIVKIIGPLGGGTGFEVKAPSGIVYTLTNKHVCEVAQFAMKDERLIPLRLIAEDPDSDLCLLEGLVGHEGLSVALNEPSANDKLDVWGYGLLLPLQHTEGRYVGHMGTKVLDVEDPGYCTANMLPGNSGSPVLDEHFQVVGVAYASGDIINMRTLFVPLDDIRDFLSVY